MANLIVDLAKYIFIILICFYTFQSLNIFRAKSEHAQNMIFLNQNYLMFLIHLMGYLVIYLNTDRAGVWGIYAAQVVLLATILLIYGKLYKKSSRLLTNNICMLLTISFIILTRLDYDASVRQFFIVAASVAISAIFPLVIRRGGIFRKFQWVFGGVGIGLLLLVALFSMRSNGAKLSFGLFGVTFQPSEFVRLIFVFFVAARFYHDKSRKGVLITSALAAAHVLILVASRDLGMGMIFFVVYIVMLYAGTKDRTLTLTGAGAGGIAAVLAYQIFSHVRVRVQAWQDPFANYETGGYQIAQSLFAIGSGGWFGLGLYKGMPSKIPYVEQDFIFSAICEEFGAIFGICLILICLSCFVMIVNVSIQLTDEFYKLVALGLGSAYAFQVFLTIGGGIKFIPLTGVTLPLISMGGSSILSSMLLFAVVQGMYILRDEEAEEEHGEEEEEERLRKELERERARAAARARDQRTGSGRRRPESSSSGQEKVRRRKKRIKETE